MTPDLFICAKITSLLRLRHFPFKAADRTICVSGRKSAQSFHDLGLILYAFRNTDHFVFIYKSNLLYIQSLCVSQ